MKEKKVEMFRIIDEDDDGDIPIDVEFSPKCELTGEDETLWVRNGIYERGGVAMTKNQALYLAGLVQRIWGRVRND